MLRTLFIIVACLILNEAWCQESFTIKDGLEREVLGKELQVLNDSSGNLSLASVIKAEFESGFSPRPNLGFSAGAMWIKTQIENQSADSLFHVLVSQPVLDTLDFYLIGSDGEQITSFHTGEHLNFESRIFKERYFILPFRLSGGEKAEIYMRIATKEQIVLPVYITNPTGTWRLITLADTLSGAYFGLILVMLFYNLFVFLSVKDRSYLLYVIYIFFVGITQAALEGYTHKYLWPESFFMASRSIYLFTSLVSIFSVVFLRNFLKTKVYAPRLDKVGLWVYIYFTSVFVFALIGVNKGVHIFAQLGITFVAIYIYITTIVVFRKGYSPAKYFLYAWTVLVIGIVVYALKDAGLIPSTPFTNYLLQFGSAVEVVLLSLALADRINTLKREKEQSQSEALRIAKENERIVLEQNVVLEQKVKERTMVLESTNHELSEIIDKLKRTQSQLVEAEKMASLGQLTAGVAHEINNPINFVNANLEPLKQDLNDVLDVLRKYEALVGAENFRAGIEEIEAFKQEIDFDYSVKEIGDLIDGIQEGAQRTIEIVKGLKDFSRIDEANWKHTDLNEGLKSTLVILRNKIPDSVELRIDLGDLPDVDCLGGKINQVFMNILSNAIDSLITKENTGIQKFIEIKSWHEDDKVYFSFEDNGMGMSEKVKNRIFEPFFTTKEVGKGTGLGLSITFSIIETHNGKISVDSVEGERTVFKVMLPTETSPVQQ